MAATRSLAGQPAAPRASSFDSAPQLDLHPRRHGRRWPVGGTIGLAIIALLVLVAIFGPTVVRTDPAHQDLLARLQPPVWAGGNSDHLLGTDGLGRDLLARVVAGARSSLLVGVVATLFAGVIGVLLGLVAGYARGFADQVVTYLTDVQMAVPFVVIAIAVVAILGNSLWHVLLVLAVSGWVGYARIVRLQALSLRQAPYVEAARVIGASRTRLVLRHILPNLTRPIIVIASQQVAAMILYEAALSYLGLGVPGDVVTWGGMVADGQEALVNAWWVATIPGLAIALTILGFNLAGDWLADR